MHIIKSIIKIRRFFFKVQPLPKSDHVVSFTDADELLRDSELASTERDEVLEAELAQNDR